MDLLYSDKISRKEGAVMANILVVEDDREINALLCGILGPVSYTHLTLPTIYSV